jgi:hypothetical protein
MDTNKVIQEFPRISTTDLEYPMRPRGEIAGVIRCDYKDFFSLTLSEVGNLYRGDKKLMKIRHDSSLVISKCEGQLKESKDFEADFDDTPFFECGINYLGRIRIRRPGNGPNAIRIIGEGTYDPSSRSTYVNKHDYTVISGIVVAALYACKRGGNEAFVDKIFKIFKFNPTYKAHTDLVNYMQYQIKELVFNKNETVDYAYYLKNWYEGRTHELLEKFKEDVLCFMYQVEIFDRLQIFPCKKYVKALEEERKIEHPLFTFVKSHPETYFRTDPLFISRLVNRPKNNPLIDLRDLLDVAARIENSYKNKISAALQARGEADNVPNMELLASKYYNCRLF